MYNEHLLVTDSTLFFKLPAELEIGFDWDETLIDSRIQFEHSLRSSLQKYGHEKNIAEFENDVICNVPPWVLNLFQELRNMGREIHIISNKPAEQLHWELAPHRDVIATITAEANKPNNPSVFHRIAKTGIFFGDSLRNDLVGAITAGWAYQHLNVGHVPRNAAVVILE